MKESKAKAFFDREVNPETDAFITKSMEIADQLGIYLKDRKMSQKEFARRLGKSEAEVCKWLSGMHNLTLKSIVKMELVLGEPIINTPITSKYHKTRQEQIALINYESKWREEVKTATPIETYRQGKFQPSKPTAA